MLQIYNSLTRQKEKFERPDRKVGLYVCGMTVYDYCHLGHARVMAVFDVIVRHLRSLGFDVTYVRNITDIDDKIIRRAQENNEDIHALTERYIAAMHEDERSLGVLPPDHEPRATASMPAIIDMIAALLGKKHAYQASNGDIYYDVSRFADYGKLSNKRVEDLRSGARVEIGEAKDDPLDFVLWKAAKPGEPAWDSPWGKGRPGWHIECSAMSKQCLGNHFDIHGGGMDLKFPHHENEIAQSEAANDGEKFVDVWVHNGFVQINEEKMSKSLGNFFTVREVLEHLQKQYKWQIDGKDAANPAGEVIRYFILQSHYRGPLNYSLELLAGAVKRLEGLYRPFIRAATQGVMPTSADASLVQAFRAAMNDDFNTPEALACLDRAAADVNSALDKGDTDRARTLLGALRQLGDQLGILRCDPMTFLRMGFSSHAPEAAVVDSTNEIDKLIQLRAVARKEKNWSESDRIRKELQSQGVLLEDNPDGTTTWRRA